MYSHYSVQASDWFTNNVQTADWYNQFSVRAAELFQNGVQMTKHYWGLLRDKMSTFSQKEGNVY